MLKWEQIDFEKNTIALPPAKTQRKGKTKWVHLPLISRLAQDLKSIDKRDCEFVLPYLSRKYLSNRTSVIKICKEAFESAGIRTSIENGKGRAISAVGFHSLRHTFVSECAKAGISLAVVQSIVGHGNPAMTRHYTHIDIESARLGIERIGTKQEPAEDKLDKIRDLVSKLTAKNAKIIKKEILKLLEP